MGKFENMQDNKKERQFYTVSLLFKNERGERS